MKWPYRVRAVRAEIRGTRVRAEQLLGETAGLQAQVGALRSELADARREVVELAARLDHITSTTGANHERLMHALRIVRDDDAGARAALWELRGTTEYTRAFEEHRPLVSIVIATYRNWPMLRDRSLPSILAQTHARLEVIVVGDAAPPEAADVVAGFGDDRVRFVNLPYRGPYPAKPADAWLVTGTGPWNTGLALAKGRWIGINGDDDALRPDHVETLLSLAREQHAEVPYGLIHQLEPGGGHSQLGTFPPEYGQWGTQAALLHAGLRYLPLQPTDWLFGVPNDMSLMERMLRIGVRFALVRRPVVDYYPSSLWSDRADQSEF